MSIRETEIKTGKLRGVAAGNPQIVVYKGIPYAEAPVGKLRWKPPVPKKPWNGVFDAVRYGNICPQMLPGKETFYYREFFSCEQDEVQSEDCLQLNVWTPAETKEERLPVLVFIHGGGFQTNYSFAPQFDGEQMASHGIVVVTINYRVGIFGFLSHPDLMKEAYDGRTGNYGLMDQILALQWVRENIEAFGGDPRRISISGGSAGAESVMLLCLSNVTRGWISGAVMQSAPLLEHRFSMEKAAEDGKHFLERIGYSSIEAARAESAEVLKQFGPDLDKGDSLFLVPCVDGVILEDIPLELLKKGYQHDIPYIVGSTDGEARSMRNRFFETPESIEKKLKKSYGKYSEEYRKSVAYLTQKEAYEFQLNHGFTEDLYTYCLTWCELQRKDRTKPTYLYRFKRKLPGDDNGAFHACEHWYVFQNLHHCWRPFEGCDYELAEKIATYWSNFVKTGDPNGKELPEWIPYDKMHKEQMILDKKCFMAPIDRNAALDARIKYMCSEKQ